MICAHKFADLDPLHVHFVRGQLIARRRQYPVCDPPESCRKTYTSDTQCLGDFSNLLDIKSVELSCRVLCGQLVVHLCRRPTCYTPFGPEFDDDGSCTVDLEMEKSMVSSHLWGRATYRGLEVSHRGNVNDGHCELWRYVDERTREKSCFVFADSQLLSSLTFYTQLACSALLIIVSQQYLRASHDVESLHLRIGRIPDSNGQHHRFGSRCGSMSDSQAAQACFPFRHLRDRSNGLLTPPIDHSDCSTFPLLAW